MPTFRKKPVVIEAWRVADGMAFPEGADIRRMPTGSRPPTWEVYDALHNSWVTFELGDWIIKGVRGEFYPCKPDVFDETYEAVEP